MYSLDLIVSSHRLYQSINVVECPEFRQLLRLLRQELRDTDISRRTKLHELIIEAWRDYFQALKEDLEVSGYFYLSYWTAAH